MEVIEKMLRGEISITEFGRLLIEDESIRDSLNSLIPQDAKWNYSHPLWKFHGYQPLLRCDFDLSKSILERFKFDDTNGDNLNVHSAIKRIHRFNFPEFEYTNIYSEIFDIELSVMGEYYGGPEVKNVIKDIVDKCLAIKTRTARIKEGKRLIREAFHTEDRNIPRWVQGAEWPMGSKSPMKFLEKKCKGEARHYIFSDVDTGEIRVIEQYY